MHDIHNFRRAVKLLSFFHHRATTCAAAVATFFFHIFGEKKSRKCSAPLFSQNYNLRNFPIIFKFMPRRQNGEKTPKIFEEKKNMNKHGLRHWIEGVKTTI